MTPARYYLAAAVLTMAVLIATIVAWPGLAPSIPTHWNVHGRPNGYSPRRALFLGPAIMAAMILLTWALPWLSPKHFEVQSFRSTYLRIMLTILAMIAWLDGVTLWIGLGHPVNANRTIFGGICLFTVLLGNLTGKIRRNFYLGIRTPWALANDRVWNATHRMAAKTLVLGGMAGFVFAVFGLDNWSLASLIAGVTLPAAYSLWFYKQLERKGEL